MSEEAPTASGVASIDTLISWAQIFKIEAAHHTPVDFLDGIAFAEILHEIDPVFFGPRWLDGFVQDCGNAWRLKQTNLQRVLSRIQDFFLEVTGSTISAAKLLPDIRVLAEFQASPSDPAIMASVSDSVFRFLQLVVGCAVSCSRRQHFIEAILNLETDIQAGVMEAVKMVLERTDGHSESVEESYSISAPVENVSSDNSAIRAQLSATLQDRDALFEKVKHLEQEIANLRYRSDSVSSAKNIGKGHIDADEDIARHETPRSEPISAHRSSVHDEIERLRDELEKVDGAKDEWRQKAEAAEHEAAVLRARVAELVSASRETKRLRDELDVARHAVERLAIAESQIEQLQRKVEQSSSAQRKLRSVEEKLQSVLTENSTLQDQLNRLRTVSKRRSNAPDSDSGSIQTTDKQLGGIDDDGVGSSLRYDWLQKQFEETTTKLAETREQLMNALGQNRSLVEENAKLRQTAAESTSNSYETLPSISNRDDETSDIGTALEDVDKDNLVLSLKAEIARRKNEALIMEQRYKKYLERARAIVKLVSVTATAGSNSRISSVATNDFQVGASFVANASAISLMRSQLRLLAEGSNRYSSSSPLRLNSLSTNGSNQQNHSRPEAAI